MRISLEFLCRKQYKSGIEIAKKQRREYLKDNREVQTDLQKKSEEKEQVKEQVKEMNQSETITIDDAIIFFQNLRGEMDSLRDENNKLKIENNEVLEAIKKSKQNYTNLKDEYHSVLSILEKARKMAVTQDTEQYQVIHR